MQMISLNFKLELVLCLRTFNTAEIQCSPIFLSAKILFQILYVATLKNTSARTNPTRMFETCMHMVLKVFAYPLGVMYYWIYRYTGIVKYAYM